MTSGRDLNSRLVTVSEAAKILGFSRQRVDQLAATSGFPRPAFERLRLRLWWRDEIEAWRDRAH